MKDRWIDVVYDDDGYDRAIIINTKDIESVMLFDREEGDTFTSITMRSDSDDVYLTRFNLYGNRYNELVYKLRPNLLTWLKWKLNTPIWKPEIDDYE